LRDPTRWQGARDLDSHRITVTITVQVSIERPDQSFVDLSIAVVVDAVADLGCSGVDRVVGVVAVGIVLLEVRRYVTA
jgi:hypothetical protein